MFGPQFEARCIERARLATLPGARAYPRAGPGFLTASAPTQRKASVSGPLMWKLVIEDDEGKRTVVPLTREQYSIGRKDGNTIRLTERNVSREHARIFKKPPNGAPVVDPDKPSFVLEDLTSYNGVFVNGLRITHAQDLAHGDLVQIGDYRIILQDELLSDIAVSAVPNDAKATLPQAPQARGQAMMDRPNRLVMLAGPTPGAEFPL